MTFEKTMEIKKPDVLDERLSSERSTARFIYINSTRAWRDTLYFGLNGETCHGLFEEIGEKIQFD